MEIKHFKIGTVVQATVLAPAPQKHGHIIGFGYNAYKELLLKVQWANPHTDVLNDRFNAGQITYIHPSNVII